jgi:hypothetical protein
LGEITRRGAEPRSSTPDYDKRGNGKCGEIASNVTRHIVDWQISFVQSSVGDELGSLSMAIKVIGFKAKQISFIDSAIYVGCPTTLSGQKAIDYCS